MYRCRVFLVSHVGILYTHATATSTTSTTSLKQESDSRTGVVVVQRNAAQACLGYTCMAVACVFLQVESY